MAINSSLAKLVFADRVSRGSALDQPVGPFTSHVTHAKITIVWLAVIILGRDVALGIAAIYYRWISLPPPKTFMRYWDFSLPSAEVHPTTISKYNTFLQLALMGITTMAPVVPVVGGMPLTIMQ